MKKDLFTTLVPPAHLCPRATPVSLVTNQFDLSGNFSFTNGITPGELQRYFHFRTP
jgi:hypothetical protein